MVLLKIATTKDTWQQDLKKHELPEKFTLTVDTRVSLNQNDCYNGWCTILANSQGLSPTEFKNVVKEQIGLWYWKEYQDGTREKKCTSSVDFTKEEWEIMFRKLEQVADFLGIHLPESNKLKIKFTKKPQ